MAISQLSDSEWDRIKNFIPKKRLSCKGGRPRICDRSCLEGILWILSTGAQWSTLPKEFPSYSTCWRRLREWGRNGTFRNMWRGFLGDLHAKNGIKWEEAFADATFSPAKKGGPKVGKTRKGKGTKIMLVTDGKGTPLSSLVESASPAEVQLLEPTLALISVAGKAGRPRSKPLRLIADRAYDSNPLRNRLARRNIKPIVPARSNNRRATHQDRRCLRRYRRRWYVERTFAWLLNYRRLTVRWERCAGIYISFVELTCALLVLRRCRAA